MDRTVHIEAGIECIERKGFSPEVRNGHLAGRYREDLAQIASCGVRRVRYGISLGRTYDAQTGRFDFSLYEGPVALMRELGLEPVLDLNHFGEWLRDADAPERMGAFAAAVARAFPWVTWYTVVNEPTFGGEWLEVAPEHVIETMAAGVAGLKEANPAARHLCVDSLCLPWDPTHRHAGPTHGPHADTSEEAWFGRLPAVLARVPVDVIGLDYYHFSEWCPFDRRAGIVRIGQACQRLFGRPFTISETSLNDDDPTVPVTRAGWLAEMVAGAEELLATCPHYDGRIYWYSWISQFDWDLFFRTGGLRPLHDGVLDLLDDGAGGWRRQPVAELTALIKRVNGVAGTGV